jgi:hypothetical protein
LQTYQFKHAGRDRHTHFQQLLGSHGQLLSLSAVTPLMRALVTMDRQLTRQTMAALVMASAKPQH